MATTAGQIGLELALFDDSFNKQLGQIKNKAKSAGDQISNELNGSFSSTSSNVKSSMASAKSSFSSGMGSITSIAKKASLAIGAAFAVDKIVGFSKECLELGSDLSEVQNVVDTVFPTMTGKVSEFAQSAAETFGLSETMAKKYTGTFGAMATSFGFTEQEAAEMATTLTGLAGDVASFYNITQDEAYTQLKSVFTGETESLKELGVVMTETALDAYAMEQGMSKTTSEMTESEKVALRYQFVLDKLSTASGDFARTSDGWANQIRVLNLQIDSFKANIGQGLINVLSPAVKAINVLMKKLVSLSEKFRQLTELIAGKKSSSSSSNSDITSTSSDLSELQNASNEASNALASSTATPTTSTVSTTPTTADTADTVADATNAITGLQDTASTPTTIATAGLNNIKDAADGVTESAKEAKEEIKSLMGFDQINKLSEQTDDSNNSSNSDSDTPTTTTPTTTGGTTTPTTSTTTPTSGTGSGGLSDLADGLGDDSVLSDVAKQADVASDAVDGLAKKLKSLFDLFKKGFDLGFADADLDNLLAQAKRVADALKDIFTDPRVVEAAKQLGKTLVETLGVITGSIARVAVEWGAAILAGIADSLEQSKEYIVTELVSILNNITGIIKQIGRIFLTLADILTAPQVLASLRNLSKSITTYLTTMLLSSANIATSIGLAIVTGIADSLDHNRKYIIKMLSEIMDAFADWFDELTGIMLTIEEILTAPKVLEAVRGLAESVITCLTTLALEVVAVCAKIGAAITGGIGDSLEEGKSKIEEKLTTILDTCSRFFDDLTELFKTLGEIFTASEALEALRNTVSDIVTIFTTLVLTVTEIVTKFGTDVMELIIQPIIDNKDRLKEALSGTLGVISEAINTVKDIIVDICEKVVALYDEHIKPLLDSLKTGISEILAVILGGYNEYILPVLEKLADKFEDVYQNHIKPFLSNVIKFIGKIIDVLKELWENILQPLIKWFVENIMPVLGPIIEAFGVLFLATIASICDTLNVLITIASAVADVLKLVFGTIIPGAVKTAESAFSAFGGVVSTVCNAIQSVVTTVFNTVKNAITTAITTATTAANNAFNALRNNITTIVNNIKTTVTNGFSTMKNSATSIFNSLKSATVSAFNAIKNAITNNVRTAVDTAKNLFNSLKSSVSSIFNGIRNSVESAFEAGANAAKNMVNTAIGAINTLINGLNMINVPDSIPILGGIGNIPTIPALAEGGYVKANTPQLAMIGDNTRYGEVVAPENKLLEMAQTAARLSSGGNSTELLTVLNEILTLLRTHDIVELDAEALRKWFIKKTNQNTMATGRAELVTN